MSNVPKIIIWVFLTTFLGSMGGTFFKIAMNRIKSVSVLTILKNKWIWLGFFLYLLSSFANLKLYKFLPYDVAYPLTSITYIWTIILSYFIFKEKLTPSKLIAVASIIFGVVLISL
ncbi:EamA family transporter [Vagococcus vulneris]|uniref:Multidrug transporter n=1 Tax=Vagococcus vulneris TaxID=1977869 RepID=A0A429ZZJ8_9ENTE|nr:EamA family transporter [Vagococcus vulneris]RST99480.1 multidrug transporter [Vagococcus vulneris]